MNITHSIEAYDLAKSVLNDEFKASFVDARILGREGERKLCFYFDNKFIIVAFNHQKDLILERLRMAYRSKLRIYKRIDFVFYEIVAEFKEREKENEKDKVRIATMERGITRIKNIIERIKDERERERNAKFYN